jgi:hypothetical protein
VRREKREVRREIKNKEQKIRNKKVVANDQLELKVSLSNCVIHLFHQGTLLMAN